MESTVDNWLSEAAQLPLAFAQVREDPRIDLACCSGLRPDATVVMIASGGDTAVCVSRLPIGRLLLVDMNAAQLALTRCKFALAKDCNGEQSMRWLGHLPLAPDLRAQRIATTLESLDLPDGVLGPLERLAALGPDFSGRYEAMFAALNRALGPSWEILQRLLESATPVAMPSLPQVDAAFAEVMSLRNLVALFGGDATRNPKLPFAEHFATRVRSAFATSVPRQNPFLWQMLAGRFPPGVAWDWLESDAAPVVEPEFVHGLMKPVLDALPACSVDFVHLSNILDWLTPAAATAVLDSAARVLKQGGRVLVRQLNSSLDIPALTDGIRWSPALGRLMQSKDRSFFYPEIHVGCPL
ncbi:MAG: hypothetical protein RL088_2417 [Verrucomicrobiota bacterium]|jgi:S-adenosylmethionine-diacylglycerol 3-amino-3-carboxypropyl transferase